MSKEDKTSEDDLKHRNVILLMGMILNGISAECEPLNQTDEQVKEIYEDIWEILDSVDTFLFGHNNFLLWERVCPPLSSDSSSSEFEKKFSRFTDQVIKLFFQQV